MRYLWNETYIDVLQIILVFPEFLAQAPFIFARASVVAPHLARAFLLFSASVVIAITLISAGVGTHDELAEPLSHLLDLAQHLLPLKKLHLVPERVRVERACAQTVVRTRL